MMDYFTPEGYLSTEVVREQLALLELKDHKLTTDEIDDIIEVFWFQDYYHNFISIPEVLANLKKYITEGHRSIKRLNFYRYHFNKLIKDSELKTELGRISVEFEKIQTNEFDKVTFKSLAIKANISKITIEWLFEKKIVWQQGDKIAWRHHTITEFFASDYILSQKDSITVADKLIIIHVEEDGTKNIKPSWLGVMKFLLESELDTKVFEWLLSLLEKFPININEDVANILTTYSPNNLEDTVKERAFNIIYDTYQEKNMWLPIWTRRGFIKFFTSKQLEKLEADVKERSDAVETYTHRGNVVAVVDSLIRQRIITDEEFVNKWKERFIVYAHDKNENGVLQRHSLHALDQFKENNGNLIAQLAPVFRSSDSMVRDAFIQFCYKTAPNTPEAIDVMVKAITSGDRIYGRHGLYEIDSDEGFLYLLQQLIDKPLFLGQFIRDESIFSGDKKEGDRELVDKLLHLSQKNFEIKNKLQALLMVALKDKNLHQLDNSFFIRKIAIELAKDNNNVLLWISETSTLHNIDDRRRYLFNLEELLPEVATIDSWEDIYTKLSIIDDDIVERIKHVFVYSLHRRKEPGGKEIFEEAAKKLDLEIRPSKHFEDEQAKREDEIYKEFKFKLEPAKNQFITDIFEYFLHNRELIEKRWSDHEKERLIYLAYEDGIKRLDPKNFSVKFEQKKQRSGRFSWSQQATFYGDMIKIVQILEPIRLNESDVKQHIINFIPFAYSDDLKIIKEIITEISPMHLKWINSVYANTEDDRRYLVPDSYINFIDHLIKLSQNVSSTRSTLESLILDNYIDDWIQVHALRTLAQVQEADSSFKNTLYKIFTESPHVSLKEEANSQLIRMFQDEAAVKWRFNELRMRLTPFDEAIRFNVHTVSDFESELDNKEFISPLIKIRKPDSYDRYLSLLQYVAEEYKNNHRYSSYLNYIWSSTLRFISQFDQKNFFEMLERTENWIKNNNLDTEKIRYFDYTLEKIRREYINELAAKENV